MKLLFSILCILFFNVAFTQDVPVGIFRNATDIGAPKISGSAWYNQADQSYTLKGAGYNIWHERDEFQYVYNTIKGDFILPANFKFTGQGTIAHRKTGWMVFIAFPPDIELNSHPSYKRVTLRLIPASGGPSRVIAYLYGGQGTINVPSWSPDSEQIAFVSNSGEKE